MNWGSPTTRVSLLEPESLDESAVVSVESEEVSFEVVFPHAARVPTTIVAAAARARARFHDFLFMCPS